MPSAGTVDWAALVAEAPRVTLMGTLWRIVESQEQKSTLELVDSLEEHDVLETILERSKPPLPAGTAHFDYLLRSPWRYPPLAWGSRFVAVFSPSIVYGAQAEPALFAEAAYYRFVFLEGMTEPLADRVISQHTVFQARYRTVDGADLTAPPFAAHEALMRHPARYADTQALGATMRSAGVQAFVYLSARAIGREQNIGLIAPAALRSHRHQHPVQVLCESRTERVQYRYHDRVISFARSHFLVQGSLPEPAS